MSLRRILNLLRVLFLGVCIVAVGARVAWTRFPEEVSRVDGWIIKASEYRVRREMNRAEDAQRAGKPEAALKHLLSIAASTDETKHGDRLERLRAKTLGAIRSSYHLQGQLEEALKWANELHALDERNTPNELERAKLYGKLGMVEESLALFEWLNYLTQGQGEYELAHFEELVRAEHGTEAVERLLRMKGGMGLARPIQGWELRYRVAGKPWSGALKIDLSDARVSRGRVEFEAQMDSMGEVRLDVPGGISLLARQPKLALSMSDGTELDLGLARPKRMNQLEAIDGGFRGNSASGPYVVVDVPEAPEGANVTGATLEVDLRPILPGHIVEFLDSDLGARSLEELAAHYQAGGGTDADRARLLELRDVLGG